MGTDPLQELCQAIQAVEQTRPLTVALDGRSGSGKSTLAAAVQERLGDCVVIEGDEFYGGGTGAFWDARSAKDKVDHCIDWARQRVVLRTLRHGQQARWSGFDWQAFDGSLSAQETVTQPAAVVVLEGAYSCRPELADLLDLRVLLDTEPVRRRRQLAEREGEEYRSEWEARWSQAEDYYFGTIMPCENFDLVLSLRE